MPTLSSMGSVVYFHKKWIISILNELSNERLWPMQLSIFATRITRCPLIFFAIVLTWHVEPTHLAFQPAPAFLHVHLVVFILVPECSPNGFREPPPPQQRKNQESQEHPNHQPLDLHPLLRVDRFLQLRVAV